MFAIVELPQRSVLTKPAGTVNRRSMLTANKPVQERPLQLMALLVPFSNDQGAPKGIYVDESVVDDMIDDRACCASH